MVKKILLYISIIFCVTIFSIPKTEMYYTFAHFLQNHAINIKNEKYQEGLFSLSLKDATIVYRNSDIGNIGNIKIYNFLFYNKMIYDNMLIRSSSNQKEIIKIDKMDAVWSIFSPKKIYIYIDSNLGKAEGSLDISSMMLKIYFNNENGANSIKEFFKKDNKGWYYESNF